MRLKKAGGDAIPSQRRQNRRSGDFRAGWASLGADGAEQVIAVLIGHGDVADEDVGAAGMLKQVEGLSGGIGGLHLGAVARQGPADHVSRIGLIIHQEHALGPRLGLL